MRDDRSWHIARARQEFDAAYRAARLDIAAIHLRLSALHMARARALNAPLRLAATPDAEAGASSKARFLVPVPL